MSGLSIINIFLCILALHHKVREMAEKCQVQDTNEFNTMLGLFHDLGAIIYFGSAGTKEANNTETKRDRTSSNQASKSLEDIVILDPQWLIDVFKAVVNIVPNDQRVSAFGLYLNVLPFT